MWHVINETRWQIKESQNAKLKSFFSFFENNCFQSHENHQLSTQIRISAQFFHREKSSKPVIIQEFSYDLKGKVKSTVKDQCEKFN